MFRLVCCFLFLAGFGVYGYLLMTNPVGLARRAQAKRRYAPFYELADSRSGRMKMRLLGLIYLVASIAGAIAVIIISKSDK
jgi:hypothetical protein